MPPLARKDYDEEPFKFTKTVCMSIPHKNIQKKTLIEVLISTSMVSTITTKSYNEDRTEKLGITLPISLLKQVDDKRGDIPRSTFICRAVESYLKGSKR